MINCIYFWVIYRIMQYVPFYVKFLLLNNIFEDLLMLSGIVAVCSFLLLYGIPYMIIPQNILPYYYWCHWLSPCFGFNHAAMSIFGCVFGTLEHTFLLGVCLQVELQHQRECIYSLQQIMPKSFPKWLILYTCF